MGKGLPVCGVAVPKEAQAQPDAGAIRAIPVVRHTGIHVSRIRYRPRRGRRRGGGILSATGGSGEPDQRSQQRCGPSSASVGAVEHELRAFPVGYAGLQHELLADAVQPGGAGQNSGPASHHAGDRPSAFSVLGGQNRAPRRHYPGPVQRSLRGEGDDGTAHGSAAGDHPERESVRASAGLGSTSLKSACINFYARICEREQGLTKKVKLRRNQATLLQDRQLALDYSFAGRDESICVHRLGVSQFMHVNNTDEHTRKTRAEQGAKAGAPKPIKIGASTPYDFQGSNMTAYGGLLPVTTMLEKLQFQQLIEEHVTIKRLTTSMPGCRFVLAMILALYVGFSRLNHLQFLQREPMLTGILEVNELPVQSTFWRFLASLHLVVARQLLEVARRMRQRVWQAAHVGLKEVTLDTDTTVQTVYGRQMGARKGYNPKH